MSIHSSLSHTAAPPHVRPQTQAWMQTVFSVISKLVIMRAASLLLALLILHMNAPWQQDRGALQKERSHRPVNADTIPCDYGRIMSWKTTDNTLWAAFLTDFHASFLEGGIKSKETISHWCVSRVLRLTTTGRPLGELPSQPQVLRYLLYQPSVYLYIRRDKRHRTHSLPQIVQVRKQRGSRVRQEETKSTWVPSAGWKCGSGPSGRSSAEILGLGTETRGEKRQEVRGPY